MPKKDKVQEVSDDVVEFIAPEPKAPVQEEPSAPVAPKTSIRHAKVKPAKRMNFARYARTKGVKATHVAGMKARAGNPNIPRTLEEWDAFFEGY